MIKRISRNGGDKSTGAILALLVMSVFITVAGCGSQAETKTEGTSAAAGDPATTTTQRIERFSLSDINGQQRNWSEFVGKPFMINFWATWCPPCRQELPVLKKLYDEYHSKGLEIIAISVDQKTGDVKPFVQQMQIPWVVLYTDERAPVELKLGRGIPMTIFFDAQGNETGRITGALPEATFRAEIAKLFPQS